MLVFISCLVFAQENKENTDFHLAISLYNDKLYDLSLEQFKRFVEIYPNTQQGVQAKFYIGQSQFQLKKYEEAKNTFQNFALSYQLHPQAPEAWWKIGECNLNMDKTNDAAMAFERIKVFHPTSELAPKGLLKSADCYILQNDFENAQRVLKMLLSEYFSDGTMVEARTKLAEVFLKLNMPDRAAEEYSKIINSDLPKDTKVQVQIALGKLYAASGKVEAAESLYKEIIINNSLNKFADSAKIELGKLYFDIGDFKNAKEYFSEMVDSSSINKSSNDRIALFNLAHCEFQLQNYLSALKYIQAFEDKYSNDNSVTALWFLAAETHRKLSDFIKSNEYYKKVIDSNNDGLDLKRSILFYAQNCFDLKNYNEALENYSKYIEKYPSDPLNPELVFHMGKIYLENSKDYRKAVSKFDEILSKYSNNRLADDALFNLAYAYEMNKELDKALVKYNELLDNYSNSPFYNPAKEKIKQINLFVSSNNTDGFRKIGALLQDVISNKPKGEISFKLGEVYYNDMKDYKSALAQFDIALTANNLPDSMKSLAHFYKMMSSYFIAMSEGNSTSDAIKSFNEYLTANPNSPKKSEIVLKLFNLDQINKSSDEISKLALEYFRKYSDLSIRDEFLGKALSIALKNKDYAGCLDYSGKIIADFKNSSFIQDAFYARAFASMSTGKDSTAERYFNEYLNQYANGRYTAGSYYYLAEISRVKNDFQKALEYYNKIKNIYFYTSFADNIPDLYAETYFESGDYKSSYRQYNQLYTSSQQNIFMDDELINSYLYKLALSAEKNNDLNNAKRYYSLYTLNNPSGLFCNESLLNLGMIYQNEGKPDIANNYFKQINNSGKDLDLTLKIANILYSNQQYQLALSNYKSIITEPKYRKEALYKTVIINYKTNNILDALAEKKLYKKEFDLSDDEKAETDFEEGSSYYRQKNYEKAEEYFSNVVDDHEKTEFAAWSAYWVGKIAENNDKIQDAQKSFNWVIAKFPNSEPAAGANLSLGNYYYRSEKYADAAKYYKNIADKSVKDKLIASAALENIIECCTQLQIYDAAIEYCRKFINNFPSDKSIPDKQLKIGILYQKLRYYDQAIVHYQSLIENANSELEVEVRYYLGECYYSKGDYSQALMEFMKVPYISGKSTKIDWIPASLYMAGQSYEKLNKYEQAITMYRQIIEKPNIESTYKAQAQKEIDRVKALLLPQKGKE